MIRSAIAANAAAAAFDRVGMPEGQFHLTQATLYLALAPKSNSTLGYFDALAHVAAQAVEVPNHLRDANRDEELGHGSGYLYPHAYRDHWVAQHYLPPGLDDAVFYRPGELGWEGERAPVLQLHRAEQLAATREHHVEAGATGPPEPPRGPAPSSGRPRANTTSGHGRPRRATVAPSGRTYPIERWRSFATGSWPAHSFGRTTAW